jgi:hypothetical protein
VVDTDDPRVVVVELDDGARAPSHAPEALEDSEHADFSPTDQFQPVIDHITGGATASG